MTYRLSLLDKSPLLPGEPATAALQRTIVLAQAAERLGYARFWVAGHHANPGLAGTAPEILIAHLAARTQRIRLGSGGVLLPHYSPYKVAETFNLLAALAPNRIDLGIGKAPGGLPDATRALRRRHALAESVAFDDLLAELDRYLAAPETGSLRALPNATTKSGDGRIPRSGHAAALSRGVKRARSRGACARVAVGHDRVRLTSRPRGDPRS